MDPKELRDKKVQRQQEILNVAKTAGREFTEEETKEFESLQREIDQLNIQMGEAERSQSATEDKQRAIASERNRISEIISLGREFGIETQKYIQDGTSIEEVRKATIEHMRASGSPIGVPGRLDVGSSAEDKFRSAAADALIMRGGIEVTKPADGAKELMSMSLRDLAIETLQGEGISGLNRRSSDELYNMLSRQFYNPTAAFPSILDNAINKSYVEGHRTAPVTFDQWTKRGTLKDFKTVENRYLAGPAGEFLEVPEGGELKQDTPTDEKLPQRKLKTYGRQFTMSRQAFINDDIEFLSKIPAKYAAAARKTQNKQVYQILVNNPAVYDGTALFSSAHKNLLASGTGVTAEAVQKMFMALQMQTDQFGESIVIRPTYIIVPIGYAFTIYTIFDSPTINTSSNTQAVNPLYRYKNQIVVVEDPTINVLTKSGAMPWFIVGDKADTDFIQVDYLNGQDIPTIRRMETPGQLGFVWDIYLDWGISVMDYRGAVKNPGISLDLGL